jgi:hypothetical protein
MATDFLFQAEAVRIPRLPALRTEGLEKLAVRSASIANLADHQTELLIGRRHGVGDASTHHLVGHRDGSAGAICVRECVTC